jgi:hypothetical protein
MTIPHNDDRFRSVISMALFLDESVISQKVLFQCRRTIPTPFLELLVMPQTRRSSKHLNVFPMNMPPIQR